MKIILNKCFGGFGLSLLATKLLLERRGKECYFYKQTKYSFEIEGGVDEYKLMDINTLSKNDLFIYASTKYLGDTCEELDNEYHFYETGYELRTDEDLINIMEEIGSENASGNSSELTIVEIPDNIKWEIDDYDGIESLHEQHRSW
jgi:hypothetical protein